MTFNGLNDNFTLNFHYYELTEKCGKRGSEPWSAEYLESAEKLRIFRRHNIVGTLIDQANKAQKFEWNRGGVALLGKSAISLKRGKIGPRLLLMTYRKQGCKRDLGVRDRDEIETFDFQSETRPRPRPTHTLPRPRRDRDLQVLGPRRDRDRDVERPRPRRFSRRWHFGLP